MLFIRVHCSTMRHTWGLKHEETIGIKQGSNTYCMRCWLRLYVAQPIISLYPLPMSMLFPRGIDRNNFHTIYLYLQDWGLDNNLVVIIITHTTLGTMPIIEDCTRCVNQGRLMDVKIAGFIKYWQQKGRTEMRDSRYSYQWALLILTLIIEHCNIFTTMVI